MISMENIDILDFMDGIPDKEFEKTKALEYYKKIRNEFKKLSNEDILGDNLNNVVLVNIIIDEECDYDRKKPPIYRMYVNGKSNIDIQEILDKAIYKFIEDGHYYFHYYCHQLQRELSEVIAKC